MARRFWDTRLYAETVSPSNIRCCYNYILGSFKGILVILINGKSIEESSGNSKNHVKSADFIDVSFERGRLFGIRFVSLQIKIMDI